MQQKYRVVVELDLSDLALQRLTIEECAELLRAEFAIGAFKNLDVIAEKGWFGFAKQRI